ncbi:hypothetical protein AVEN_51909-1 [Araneus ventricosus]|uniref:Uncharacterized protein n=1 Tax=Araneus ventricosus TaxID=182803 RepID=A0A4Y2U921_ARAVE|nr:hypothetical protein AVEN_18555-1 [Araneus ventricosus]GBO09499.1 hypothetical protein AVEN_51909-1 [Araneus ventricosus]
MLSDGVNLLHGNTHAARKTQELLRKFKWEVWSHSPDSAPNLGSKHLSGTRFSSESDVKTVVENWLYKQGHDFYRARLSEFVLRSDKCRNRFGDYVEKWSFDYCSFKNPYGLIRHPWLNHDQRLNGNLHEPANADRNDRLDVYPNWRVGEKLVWLEG